MEPDGPKLVLRRKSSAGTRKTFVRLIGDEAASLHQLCSEAFTKLPNPQSLPYSNASNAVHPG
ncbi:hypothetical protein T265_10198 [Opisthorchis viverrini]|uniref:Uncharacterized protein n=1 Tax=Opisthorchis viverrini TaxID=6198 RepID=A0A074Z396_OPIVI|nr:hypothetical protein T265_10198 [Opisthorchis viverrini]KER21483.1 hypothetical protein T265_10198 [Opisthorchis viverrini]